MKKRDRAILKAEQLEDRLVPAVLDLTGVEFRTIDGTNNNLTVLNPLTGLFDQGAAETRMVRFGYGVEFADNDPGDIGDILVGPDTIPSRPNSRTISNEILDQNGSIVNDRHLTDWAFQWGQWITHDLDLTRTGPQYNILSDGVTVGDFSIAIEDPLDPLGPNPIPFNRSEYDEIRRHQINSITSYIDASNVYGSDDVRAAALRTFQGGKLRMSADGQLLPLNDLGLPNADALGKGDQLFLAGDVRANEQVNLTVVHTLFAREHNRLADRIAQLYPTLNDEQIYQVARRIVGAEMQIITYEEYLPAIFGHDLAPDPEAAAYNTNVNAAVTNSFAHAIFRFGHSQINETTLVVNNAGQTVDALSIRDAFFNPEFLKNNPDNVGKMLLGLASQLGQENDLQLVDGIRNNLFGPPSAGGLDLGALDIERGRDHGLPDYNNLRNAYGVGRVTSFDQISSDPVIQQKLFELYGNVENIDPFVGALAEDHLTGSSAGALIHAVVVNQFERLRDGDRFFYTNDPFLQSAAIRQIIDLDNLTLAKVIKANTNITNIQDNVFFDKSVLVFEAPKAGSNVSVVAALGVVTIVDNQTGDILALRSLNSVSRVILVGSNTSSDVFNLFIAASGGGLEDGVVVYGNGGTGDRLNVFGRLLQSDAFTVTDTTYSTGSVDVLGPDIVRTISGADVTVNGNEIYSSGFETLRIVTLFGNDTVIGDTALATIVSLWNPLSGN
jgi:peroxidase